MPFDRSKFIGQFKTESGEYIQKLNLGLLKLEKSPKNNELLEVLMRMAHSFKGAATMMGYKRIADIAHSIEDGLQYALKQKVRLEKSHFDVLFKCVDALGPLLEDKLTWKEKGIERPFIEDLCEEVNDAFSGRAVRAKKKRKKVRGDEKKAEGLLDAELADFAYTVNEASIRVDLEKLDKLINITGELTISRIRLNELVNNLSDKVEARMDLAPFFDKLIRDFSRVRDNISSLSNLLQEEVMKVRMISVSHLFNNFPRAMRDLAAEKGKEINFQIKGEEIQLDKVIIDEMKDPIMHLLRNAIDHGMESPQERRKGGKSESGNLTLSSYQEGAQIAIEVSDDGKGIDIKEIKEQAVENGLVSKQGINDMADEQVYQLLFTPGFTTKKNISETSGRGIGLDVVREKIVKLKGIIEVRSRLGAGTSFTMKLPLTLAITESLLLVAGSDIFAVSIDNVIETIRINQEEIKTVEGREVITVRGYIIPLVRLNDIFGVPRKGIFEKKLFPVVIVQSVESRIAILTDELLGRQKIINKSIGDPLRKVRNISGVTILGSGRVIMILDIHSIIEAARGVITKRLVGERRQAAVTRKKKTILLAEDVVTTAMLQKNILESVGYSVVIARDGKEALEKAKQESFDLIITDVLMPRMDGFELVSHLRKYKLYKDTPIIIVTTRESEADKRRGLEAGADAYILKKDFTSEGLLDIIERLLG
ncbi:MAG: hybrid sensor histidine kinase/response regulator [Candidatus Omnitrophota bacterium]